MLDVKPLDGPFGVEIRGLDLSKAHSADAIRELVHVFHTHQVVLISDQRMALEDFTRTATWFGTPHANVAEKSRLTGHPHVTFLTNAGDRRNSSAYWHTDNSYEKEPATATMLWARTVPPDGGRTAVADMYSAYEALPGALRKQIDGLRTLNGWIKREEAFVWIPLPEIPEHRKQELGIVAHPLVLVHPVTGRKALYSVTGSSFRIEGMPPDEGMDLLRELTAHALQERFQLRISYHVNDVAAWDTLATLHSAMPQSDPSVSSNMLREMYRISVKGLSPYAAVD